MSAEDTIQGEFRRMDGERSSRLDASEQYAYYTLPYLFPREGSTGNNETGVGMLDSIGATVTNHFANKLVTTLFSPNRPFFRLAPAAGSKVAKEIDEALADPAQKAQATALLSEFRIQSSRTEKDAIQHLEKISYRTAAVEAAKLLIVTGDTVIKNPGDGERPTAYSMRDYVAKKAGDGGDMILIIRDDKKFATFDQEIQELLMTQGERDYEADTDVVLYTRYELQDDGRYKITQATDDIDLLSTDEILVPKNKMMHTHLSWNLHRGEDYGRGLVEDYSGSFHMIDALSRTIAHLAARIAGQKIFVHPQSNVDVDEINSSDSSTYVSGDPNMIGTAKMADPQDIIVLEGIVQGHKRMLSGAFLFGSGTTRDAERVTAEEIRDNAEELEVSHGGVYSRFSSDWQAKVAFEAVSSVEGKDLDENIDAKIVTGMDSLSRQGEMQSIRVWIQDLSMLNQLSEGTQAIVKQAEFARFAGAQRGVDTSSFVMSPEEIQAAMKAEEDRAAKEAAREAETATQTEIAKGV